MNKKIFFGILAAALLCGGALYADSLDKIAKKISKAGKELKNKKVAVLPFPYHDGRESEGSTIISERLITKLVDRGALEVIERSLLEKVFKELKLQASGAIDEQSAKQIGKVLGVEAVVSGTLIELEVRKVEVNARLIQTESGKIVVAASGEIDKFWKDSAPAARAEERSPQDASPALPSVSAPTNTEPVAIGGPATVMSNKGEETGPFRAEHSDLLLREAELPAEVYDSPLGRSLTQGFDALKGGDYAAAESIFNEIQRNASNQPKVQEVARLGYGIGLFAEGKKEQAVETVNEVAYQKRFPRVSAAAHFVLGRFNENMGRPRIARQHFLEAVRVAPYQTPMVQVAGQRLQRMDRRNNFQERRKDRREYDRFKNDRRPNSPLEPAR